MKLSSLLIIFCLFIGCVPETEFNCGTMLLTSVGQPTKDFLYYSPDETSKINRHVLDNVYLKSLVLTKNKNRFIGTSGNYNSNRSNNLIIYDRFKNTIDTLLTTKSNWNLGVPNLSKNDSLLATIRYHVPNPNSDKYISEVKFPSEILIYDLKADKIRSTIDSFGTNQMININDDGWNLDATQFVFSVNNNRNLPQILDNKFTEGIYIYDLNNNNILPINNHGHSPKWSQELNKIAYMHSSGIFVYDMNTNKQVEIYNSDKNNINYFMWNRCNVEEIILQEWQGGNLMGHPKHKLINTLTNEIKDINAPLLVNKHISWTE